MVSLLCGKPICCDLNRCGNRSLELHWGGGGGIPDCLFKANTSQDSCLDMMKALRLCLRFIRLMNDAICHMAMRMRVFSGA